MSLFEAAYSIRSAQKNIPAKTSGDLNQNQLYAMKTIIESKFPLPQLSRQLF